MRLTLQIISWVNIAIALLFALVSFFSTDSTTQLGCWMFVGGLTPIAIVALVYAHQTRPVNQIDQLKAEIAALRSGRMV